MGFFYSIVTDAIPEKKPTRKIAFMLRDELRLEQDFFREELLELSMAIQHLGEFDINNDVIKKLANIAAKCDDKKESKATRKVERDQVSNEEQKNQNLLKEVNDLKRKLSEKEDELGKTKKAAIDSVRTLTASNKQIADERDTFKNQIDQIEDKKFKTVNSTESSASEQVKQLSQIEMERLQKETEQKEFSINTVWAKKVVELKQNMEKAEEEFRRKTKEKGRDIKKASWLILGMLLLLLILSFTVAKTIAKKKLNSKIIVLERKSNFLKKQLDSISNIHSGDSVTILKNKFLYLTNEKVILKGKVDSLEKLLEDCPNEPGRQIMGLCIEALVNSNEDYQKEQYYIRILNNLQKTCEFKNDPQNKTKVIVDITRDVRSSQEKYDFEVSLRGKNIHYKAGVLSEDIPLEISKAMTKICKELCQ